MSPVRALTWSFDAASHVSALDVLPTTAKTGTKARKVERAPLPCCAAFSACSGCILHTSETTSDGAGRC
jgi:hypothetical protein